MSGILTKKNAGLAILLLILLTAFASILALADSSEKDVIPFGFEISQIPEISVGQSISVPVTKIAGSETMHGFDFKIGFDTAALSFTGVSGGELFEIPGTYEWESIEYQIDFTDGAYGTPTGIIRCIAIAETNDGAHHPLELNLADGTEMFTLDFKATSNIDLAGEFTPLKFYWIECGDNGIAYGDLIELAVSDHVYDITSEITDTMASMPSYTGAPWECLTGDPSPFRFADFNGSGVQFSSFLPEYELEVMANDTTAFPNDTAMISIYMNNYVDTVAGFEFLLMLEHPNLIQFMNDDDIFDTTNTLCSGWPQIYTRSIGSGYNNLKILGSTFSWDPPYYIEGIPPQSNGLPLIKIPVEVFNVPDTTSDRNVTIYIQADNLDNFSFAAPGGTSIGVITDTIVDTSWFNCLIWNEDSSECLLWEEVAGPPADSFWCCDTLLHGYLDTSAVYIKHGSLTVLSKFLCGDLDGNELVNILDITALINCLYVTIDPPCDMSMMDVNCSGQTNILDITFIINFLYNGGPAPSCDYCNN